MRCATVESLQDTSTGWVDKITGMCHTHLELDPIRDAAIAGVVDAELARLRHRTALPAPPGPNSR